MKSSLPAPATVHVAELDRPAPLEIALFGTLAVRRGDERIALRLPDQAIRLLAYLLLNRARIQPREHVAFTLWPDDEEVEARANLRRKLHLIGKALPPAREPWIVTTNTSIGWNPAASYQLDVQEFETLIGAGSAAAADALYCGELLVGFDDEWIVRERERLATLAATNVLDLVAAAQRRRDYPAAIGFAQRMRALDPWREDAVRVLMTLRYEAGDRAGALTEYERFRTSVKSEMGVEPMPETVCVYESIRDHAVAGAGGGAAGTASGRAVHALPFVARARELADITAAWNAASAGDGAALLVVGEAGIGKSRLIDEFATFAQTNGGRVLRGGTTPFEAIPHQPFSEAFRSALPILRDARIEPLWLAVLATLVPGLRTALPDLPPVTALEAEPERARLFEAVDVALTAISSARPTVLILEDVHWAGATTTSLIEYVVRRATQKRLLIVASYREDELARTHPLRAIRRRLERERLLRSVALGPLEATAIEEIVGQFVDAEQPQRAAIAHYLHEASDGNPFFLGEVVANDRETGVLDAEARRWHMREPSIASLLSVASALSARLERLSPRTRSIAEIAAIIGRSFSAELLREVSGIDERTTLDCLDELIDRRLVRDIDASGIDFAFSHQLIQQAVYAEMTLEAQQVRHRRIGSVIEEMYSEQVEDFAGELAAHFDRGGETEHAALYYALAARRALSLFGTHEAQILAERGLDLARDAATRFRCIEIIEEAARRLGDRETQRACIAELVGLAAQIGAPESEREALRRQIELAHDCGERDAERTAIDALEGKLSGAPAAWTATFAQLKGSYLTAIGSYREARAVMANALACVNAADHPRIYVRCRCALVELAGFEGRVADVTAFLADVPAFEREYDLAFAVTLLETACAAASKIQDFRTLASCAERLLTCSQAIGNREGEAAAYKFAGRAALRLFEIDRARTYLDRASTMFAAMGQRLKHFQTLIDIANLATTIGRFDEAIAQFESADAIAASISYGYGSVACANNVSYAAYLKGDFDLARSAALRALAAADRINAPSARAHALVSLGVAERERRELAAAIVHLEEGTQLERELNESIALGEDLCELIIAFVRAGRLEDARARLADVLALMADPALTFLHPQRLLWTAAVVFRAIGDGAQAGEFLRRAREAAAALEATITDAASRLTFRGLPYHRAIDDAVNHDRWLI